MSPTVLTSLVGGIAMPFIRYVHKANADGSGVIGFVNTEQVFNMTYDVKSKILVLHSAFGKSIKLRGEAAEHVAKAIRRLPSVDKESS